MSVPCCRPTAMRRTLLLAAWGWMLLFAVPPGAGAQLIDTVHDPFVTDDDTLNYRLVNVVQGFTLHILDPLIKTGKGLKVKNGFDTYYIHVVYSEEVYIDSVPLRYSGQPMLLAVASLDKRLKLPDSTDTLTSRALFIKGIVVEEDKKRRKEREKAEKARQDSLTAAAPDDTTTADDDLELLRQANEAASADANPPAKDELPPPEAQASSPKEKKEKKGGFLRFGKRAKKTEEANPDSTLTTGGATTAPASEATGPTGPLTAPPDTTAVDSAARDSTPPDPYPGVKGKEREWLLLADQYKHMADSVQQRIDSTFMPEPDLYDYKALLEYNAQEARIAAAAYHDLPSGGKGLAKFFASHYFARSERYHVMSHPYGLPEYTRPPKRKTYRLPPETQLAPDVEYKFGVYLPKETQQTIQAREQRKREKERRKNAKKEGKKKDG